MDDAILKPYWRRPGLGAGTVVVTARFFDPLPDEELRLFEDGHPGDPLRLPGSNKLDDPPAKE